jgi:hypothetical protein
MLANSGAKEYKSLNTVSKDRIVTNNDDNSLDVVETK